jgi:hypothetical protein
MTLGEDGDATLRSDGDGITGDCSGERAWRHDSLVGPCRPEGGCA